MLEGFQKRFQLDETGSSTPGSNNLSAFLNGLDQQSDRLRGIHIDPRGRRETLLFGAGRDAVYQSLMPGAETADLKDVDGEGFAGEDLVELVRGGRGRGHGGRGRGDRAHSKKPAPPPSEPPPTLRAMLTQSTDLNRMVSGDRSSEDFQVERTDEDTFKSNYVNEALRIGHTSGIGRIITKDLVRRIYAFEAGGWGTADTLSGMNEKMFLTPEQAEMRETFKPASSAVGYNQVIRPTTLYLMHIGGGNISNRLTEMAQEESDPERRAALEKKSELVRNLSATITRSAEALPIAAEHHDHKGKPTWTLFAKLANSDAPATAGYTGRQIGTATHALHLDKDIGPLIQGENLRLLIDWAHQNNIRELLADKVKTINTRAKEFDSLDPIRRGAAVNEVVKFMRTEAGITDIPQTPEETRRFAAATSLELKLQDLRPGQDHSLARGTISAEEARLIRTIIAHAGGLDKVQGKFSDDAKRLVAKVMESHFRGSTGDEMLPAAIELANLVGTGRALQMLRPDAANRPAKHFFSGAGYKANPIAHRRSASQLLSAIHHRMNAVEMRGLSKPGLSKLMLYLDNAQGDEP